MSILRQILCLICAGLFAIIQDNYDSFAWFIVGSFVYELGRRIFLFIMYIHKQKLMRDELIYDVGYDSVKKKYYLHVNGDFIRYLNEDELTSTNLRDLLNELNN